MKPGYRPTNKMSTYFWLDYYNLNPKTKVKKLMNRFPAEYSKGHDYGGVNIQTHRLDQYLNTKQRARLIKQIINFSSKKVDNLPF